MGKLRLLFFLECEWFLTLLTYHQNFGIHKRASREYAKMPHFLRRVKLEDNSKHKELLACGMEDGTVEIYK
jgi:hypothetical protein